LQNIFSVLIGKLSWVGYVKSSNSVQLPKIKAGILNPADAMKSVTMDDKTMNMMNEHYAKNYDALYDLKVIFKAYRFLGK
jgi:lipopolysaccharide/colanic/teichoic acid biosynthesis glycosyltransferase